MHKIFRISFSLKNAYRVNSILYSLKQIPLIKKILPDALYSVWELKIFANVISALWEIVMALLGKFLYLIYLIVTPLNWYQTPDRAALFWHILIFLTIIGSYINSFLFNPTKDKYYAIILMRINTRKFTLVNYGYEMLKVFIGFGIFGILLGLGNGLSLGQCLFIPCFIVGLKFCAAAHFLDNYEKKGIVTNENQLSKWGWLLLFLLLVAAYGLPAIKLVLPILVSVFFAGACIVMGGISLHKIIGFPYYKELYRELFVQMANQMDVSKESVQIQKEINRNIISSKNNITSKRKGIAYLNDLFIKRHQRILWNATGKITMVCGALFLVAMAVLNWKPENKEIVNDVLMSSLPGFVIIMYAISRGMHFTRALFINCDHSLLTYSFFKQPKFILRLFQLRLWEIIKINLLPAGVIGVGMAGLLWLSGGTDKPLDYMVFIVSVCSLSVFFSVHHLTIYYILQPYNAETEIRSGTYQIVNVATYFACFYLMDVKMSSVLFGSMTIVFCVLYCIGASILVYFLAPRTFRIRG